MNSKGQIFIIGTVLLIGIFLTTAYVGLTNKQAGKDQDVIVGSYQRDVVVALQEGDAILHYIDQAAQLALFEGLRMQAEQGGLSNTKQCGDAAYALWNNKDTTCFPDIEKELPVFFNSEFSKFVLAYPNRPLLIDNHNLQVVDSGNQITIRGTAKTKQTVPISRGYLAGTGFGDACLVADIETIDSSKVNCESTVACKLQKDALERLYAVVDSLPAGTELVVTSSYRTKQDQQMLLDLYSGPAYVGKVAAATCFAPHVTGGAVDVKLRGRTYDTGNIVISGDSPTADQLRAREALLSFMCAQGWVNYDKEWWHFEYGVTNRWADAQQYPVGSVQRCVQS